MEAVLNMDAPDIRQAVASYERGVGLRLRRLLFEDTVARIGRRRAGAFPPSKESRRAAQPVRSFAARLCEAGSIFQGKHPSAQEGALDRMKRKIDSEAGRAMIMRRFATVEPAFGNIRHNKGMDRFTLRGRAKVDGQWKLYCLVHNIEKLAKSGYAK